MFGIWPTADFIIGDSVGILQSSNTRERCSPTGLQTMLSWTGAQGSDTVAIGDSEADLAMVRVAKRSVAPAQIKCKEATRSLVHADRRSCDRCRSLDGLWL